MTINNSQLNKRLKNNDIVVQLALKILAILLIAFGIGIFLTDNPVAYAKGLFFGGIFSIVKLKLMENTFGKAVTKPPEKAKTYASAHYFIRYLLTIIVMVVGALEPSISIVGVIIGLLAMKFAAFWHGYAQKPTPKDGSVEFVEWEDDEDEESDW